MNFLAHQFLSFEIEPVMVGNFIADTVKGKDFKNYNIEVQKGILLHRFIDTFTDGHRLTMRSRERLYEYFGKYAAVVQDVFYDHFLALHWKDYHIEELKPYTKFIYSTLSRNRSTFNQRAERTFHYMQLQDWLSNYATEDGIDRALTGLSNRASFQSNMEKSLPALKKHKEALLNDFVCFFPELVAATKEKLDQIMRETSQD